MPGPIRNPSEAFQQLEAIMLRQMLQSSGAFRASSTPGAQLRTDLFIETLADAVAKAGGLGIAHMLERQMGGNPSQPKVESTQGSFALNRPHVGSPGSPGSSGSSGSPGSPGSSGSSLGSPGSSGAVGGRIDTVDDPNSEAPLPEDPTAPSIDDYQIAATTQLWRIGDGQAAAAVGHPGQATNPHLQLRKTTHNHLPGSTSGPPAIPITRALNRYRERVEEPGAGIPFGAGGGEKQ